MADSTDDDDDKRLDWMTCREYDEFKLREQLRKARAENDKLRRRVTRWRIWAMKAVDLFPALQASFDTEEKQHGS